MSEQELVPTEHDALLAEVQTLHRILNIQAKWIQTITEHYQAMNANLHTIQKSALDIGATLTQFQEQLRAEIATLPDRRPTAGGSG